MTTHASGLRCWDGNSQSLLIVGSTGTLAPLLYRYAWQADSVSRREQRNVDQRNCYPTMWHRAPLPPKMKGANFHGTSHFERAF